MIHGKTETPFRPVGPLELELIRKSNWTKFSPQLPGQQSSRMAEDRRSASRSLSAPDMGSDLGPPYWLTTAMA